MYLANQAVFSKWSKSHEKNLNKRWNKKHFSSFLKDFQVSKIFSKLCLSFLYFCWVCSSLLAKYFVKIFSCERFLSEVQHSLTESPWLPPPFIVSIGVSTLPSKIPPPLFQQDPPLNLQTVPAPPPFQANPPYIYINIYIIGFLWPPPHPIKIWFFSEPPWDWNFYP